MNALSSTALSGLAAAQTRLAASAHNVANLNTPGFRRDEVRAQADPNGGVRVSVQQAQRPGADLVRDVVEQKAAAYAFKANLQVLKTERTTTGSLFDAVA